MKEDLVPGDDDWISDESSFYGDDPSDTFVYTVPSLFFHAILPNLPATIAFTALKSSAKSSPATPRSKGKGKAKGRFHHPYDGDPTHLQSTETPATFLARLPPSTSTAADIGPWLWVHDPQTDPSITPSAADTTDTAAFLAAGQALLDGFRAFETQTRTAMPGKAESAIGRKLMPKRLALEKEIRQAAKKAALTSGKWLLFPRDEEVDGVWRRVCEGVVEGRLGMTAKVATAGEDRVGGGVRLVCVYTRDFGDVGDVRRVLGALVEMGLVGDMEGQGIYYKADAYTVLGIESRNDFKLKASMYSSKVMLGKDM